MVANDTNGLVWTPCKRLGAQGVWCVTCKQLLDDDTSPFKLGSVKWLHQNGSGEEHKVKYVRLEKIVVDKQK